MDSLGIQSGYLWKQFKLGSDNFIIIDMCIQQDQTLKEVKDPSFHMASYLLIVIYARNVFANMNLRWHVAELLVHVYFSILWENRYKKSYAFICDEFIARIHFIIFKKECPILSAVAKKMVAKVVHWYLDERSTYIRVFMATRVPHILPMHVRDRLIVG
jgi:hypothetical protein